MKDFLDKWGCILVAAAAANPNEDNRNRIARAIVMDYIHFRYGYWFVYRMSGRLGRLS